MNVREITRKLRAWEAGQPIPRYDTIHHAIVPPNQALIVAFVPDGRRVASVGYRVGSRGSEPTLQSVPDGRVRDDVAVLCADFAEDLAWSTLRVHNWTYDPVDQTANPAELRQVWLPNGQHVAMLHHLSYTYSQTKYGGGNQEILRALGRLAGWMFRDTSALDPARCKCQCGTGRCVRLSGAGRPNGAPWLSTCVADGRR